jgi:hypothetical protein
LQVVVEIRLFVDRTLHDFKVAGSLVLSGGNERRSTQSLKHGGIPLLGLFTD